jgi:hypothetical protein
LFIRNTGIPLKGDLSVTDDLPAGLNYTAGSFSVSPSGGTFSSLGNSLKWIGPVVGESPVILTFIADVGGNLNTRTMQTNTAQFAASEIPNLLISSKFVINGFKINLPVIKR